MHYGIFFEKRQKVLDKSGKIWYNIYARNEERREEERKEVMRELIT